MKKSTREKRISPDERIILELFEQCNYGNDEADCGYCNRCVCLIAEALGIILYRTRLILTVASAIAGAVGGFVFLMLLVTLFF